MFLTNVSREVVVWHLPVLLLPLSPSQHSDAKVLEKQQLAAGTLE